jgi:hypothetical protein
VYVCLSLLLIKSSQQECIITLIVLSTTLDFNMRNQRETVVYTRADVLAHSSNNALDLERFVLVRIALACHHRTDDNSQCEASMNKTVVCHGLFVLFRRRLFCFESIYIYT